MNRIGQLIGSLVVGYLLIGVLIFVVQSFAGASCDPLMGERRLTGRTSLAMTALLWPSDLAAHLGGGEPLSEYFAPSRCVDY